MQKLWLIFKLIIQMLLGFALLIYTFFTFKTDTIVVISKHGMTILSYKSDKFWFWSFVIIYLAVSIKLFWMCYENFRLAQITPLQHAE